MNIIEQRLAVLTILERRIAVKDRELEDAMIRVTDLSNRIASLKRIQRRVKLGEASRRELEALIDAHQEANDH
jgi:hypothetical protein